MPSMARSGLKSTWSSHRGANNDENKQPNVAHTEKLGFVSGFLRTVSGGQTAKATGKSAKGSMRRSLETYDPEREAIKVSSIVAERDCEN